MTDVSVFYFMSQGGVGDTGLLSKRRAILDTIKDSGGEPVLQSRRVVDHTEVDGNGFLVGGASDASRRAQASISYWPPRAQPG